MDNVNITIRRAKAAPPGKQPLPSSTPYDKRYGFTAMVTELHPENNTVQVRTDTGRVISNVRVASSVWVTVDKDKGFLSGQRDLPPVDTMVFCMMPNGEYSSAFVLCSLFSDDAQHAAFKEDSKDAQFIVKRIDNSGWTFTENKKTGGRAISNKPQGATLTLAVNQEEEGKHITTLFIYENMFEIDEENKKITADIHGNVITIDEENGIKIEAEKNLDMVFKGNANTVIEGNVEETVKGDEKEAVEGEKTIEAKKAVMVKSSDDGVSIEGKKDMGFKSSGNGKLDIGNTVATLGALVSDLLDALISFKSVGSPANHASPDLTAAATQIKAKWSQVFT